MIKSVTLNVTEVPSAIGLSDVILRSYSSQLTTKVHKGINEITKHESFLQKQIVIISNFSFSTDFDIAKVIY